MGETLEMIFVASKDAERLGALPMRLGGSAIGRWRGWLRLPCRRDTVTSKLIGDIGPNRPCSPDVGPPAPRVVFAQLGKAAAIEGGCELRVDFQHSVVVGDRFIQPPEP